MHSQPPKNMNRRQFGLLAVGGVLSATATRVFAASPERSDSKVVVGIHTYSYRDHSLDQALAERVKIGITQCDLWQGHLLPLDPVGKDPVAEIARSVEFCRHALVG